MTDISVIILVGQEERHIGRCLEKLAPLEPRQVFVVESQKGDRTHEIVMEKVKGKGEGEGDWEKVKGRGEGEGDWEKVKERGEGDWEKVKGKGEGEETVLSAVWHDWPGNQAAQFNWALDNLPIEGEWVLRLDADEYLTDELIDEIKSKQLAPPVNGVVIRLRQVWKDVWVRGGMYPTRILRLFRRGHGRSDGKLMDEHIVVDGDVVEFEHDFVNHSLISVAEWEEKHRGYAKREAQSFLSGERSHGARGALKWCYYHLLPSFARPAIYWFKRAIFNGAYFESPEARDFTYRHAFWYRTLVEREIAALRKNSSSKN